MNVKSLRVAVRAAAAHKRFYQRQEKTEMAGETAIVPLIVSAYYLRSSVSDSMA